MNKFIRFSILLILLVLAGILILAFVEPNDVTVTRRIVINTPKEPVFEQIVNFRNWPNWGIVHQRDTAVKVTYSGTDGQQGAIYHWAGDEHITGEGEMKNEGVEGTTMKYTFTLTKPGEMLADGTITAKDTGDNTVVIWTFHKHFPFLANAALVVFDLDKYIGGDFETALAALKLHVEKNTKVKPKVIVKEVEYPGHIFAGTRQEVGMGEVTALYSSIYIPLSKALGGKVWGPLTGLYYKWDTIAHRTDVMVALPVTDSAMRLKLSSYIYLPPAHAFMAVHNGGYSALADVHATLNKYMAAKGRTATVSIEEYPTGPLQEPDSAKWITNVYYLVQ